MLSEETDESDLSVSTSDLSGYTSEDGQAEPDDRLRLSHYKVVGTLGAGGEGVVLHIINKSTNTDYALKLVELEMGWLSRKEESMRELTPTPLKSVVGHHCIVRLYDFCVDKSGRKVANLLKRMKLRKRGQSSEDANIRLHSMRDRAKNGCPFLALRIELCRQRSLRGWLDLPQNSMPEDYEGLEKWQLDRLKMFRQVVDGIKHIHGNRLIHRDIKSENIFVDEINRVKVGDFGAAIVHADPSLQLTHSSKKGTPLYWAPEMAYGEKYGHQVDIFSLGLLLLELMFDIPDKNRLKTFEQVKHYQKFPPFREDDIYCSVKDLVIKMTQLQIDERCSMKEVGDETARLVQFLIPRS